MPATSGANWSFVIPGSRGLGPTCAVQLAAGGQSVVITYGTDAKAAEAVSRRTLDAGAREAGVVRLPLEDPHGCESAVRSLIHEIGRPYSVVHSAASAPSCVGLRDSI